MKVLKFSVTYLLHAKIDLPTVPKRLAPNQQVCVQYEWLKAQFLIAFVGVNLTGTTKWFVILVPQLNSVESAEI